MPIIRSCCCWQSLRRGCYASAIYTTVYFAVTVVTMGHFIDMEQRFLNGEVEEPVSDSFLEPEKITPITVSLNIILLACSTLGIICCVFLAVGVYKDIKAMLLPWIITMGSETVVELVNLAYLLFLQAMNFNPITSFLFTLDFFIIMLNLYAMVCVISQFQEYLAGRGTAEFDLDEQVGVVQYTVAAQQVTTTSSAVSGRRRSAVRPPAASRCDPEEVSGAPPRIITSVLSKPSRSAIKKHVQFPDEQSCIEEGSEATPPSPPPPRKSEGRVISSLWMEQESEAPAPER